MASERQATDRGRPAPSRNQHLPKEQPMPFVNVKLIKGVFDAEQKQEMIES